MKLCTLKNEYEGNSALPRYLQYAVLLEEWLRMQKPEAGSRFPGDHQLSRHFGTTPVTISRSIHELVRKGLLERRVGSGTYVTGRFRAQPKRIGLFCHEVITPDAAYITPLLRTFYDYWAEAGYQVVSLRCRPDEYEKTIREYELAGALILVPTLEILQAGRELANAGLPLVSVGYADASPDNFSFGTNHAEAAKRVVQDLHSLGHRRIAILQMDNTAAILRFRGYQTAMWELGLPVNPAWCFDASLSGLEEALRAPDPPTAMLITQHSASIIVYDYALHHNIRIPDDLSVITFDDSEFIRSLNPPFATCVQNITGFTKCASEVLFDKIRHKTLKPPPPAPEPAVIIRRASLKPINP